MNREQQLHGKVEPRFSRWMGIIKDTARKFNSSAAIPCWITGEPIINLSKQLVGEVISRAAVASYAISSGNKRLYEENKRKTTIPDVPEISSLSFSGINHLSTQEIESKNICETYTKEKIIQEITDVMNVYDKRVKGAQLSSPYLLDGNPLNQVDMTDEMNDLRWELEENVIAVQQERNDVVFSPGEQRRAVTLEIKEQPEEAIVVNSVVRTHLLPTNIPINTLRGDFDSGNCDTGLSDSHGRGDRVVILASFGEHVLVVNKGVRGWMKKEDVVTVSDKESTSNSSLSEKFTEFHQKFFIDDHPHFYVNSQGQESVLLPGDIMYEKKDGSGIYVLEKREKNSFSFNKLSDIHSGQITDGIKTPQEFLNFLYHLKLPYMWANFDCSEIIRRAFLMCGKMLSKYSQDIINDILPQEQQKEFIDPADLDSLSDGVYLVNLLDPKDGSVHIYVDTVKDHKHNVFSYAFQLLNDDGEVDSPVGPHICSKAALSNQMTVRGRKLVCVQIAA